MNNDSNALKWSIRYKYKKWSIKWSIRYKYKKKEKRFTGCGL